MSLIELAPVLLSLPTFLVSLTLTFPESNINTSLYSLTFLQSALFASLTSLLLLFTQKFINSNELNNSNSTENVHCDSVFSITAKFSLPLGLLYASSNYLGPLRLLSLLVISQILSRTIKTDSHRSIEMENNYIAHNSYIKTFCKKYQIYFIFFTSFAFDAGISYFEEPKNLKNIFLGYIIVSIPYFSNCIDYFNQKSSVGITTNTQLIRINSIITLSTIFCIFLQFYELYNFKMLMVSFGSLLILLICHFETLNSDSLRIYGLLRNILNIDTLLKNYKTNYIILNSVATSIIFLNKTVSYQLTNEIITDTFFKYYILLFIFNVVLIYVITPGNETVAPEVKDSYSKTKLDKHTGSTTFYSLLLQVVKSEESKSIFNFLLLNIAFMFIQLLYSFRSKSLSLLSDSLHMLLDCISLILGLLASVISKNNADCPQFQYPFGLNRIGTLSGFTNGSLLLGIVFGIYNESIQRFLKPVSLENTTELLIVSTLGFLVNLVGIFAFNHGHDHSHGHSHSHEHSHNHGHSHGHSHSHSHIHEHSSIKQYEPHKNCHETDKGNETPSESNNQVQQKQHSHIHEREHELEHSHGLVQKNNEVNFNFNHLLIKSADKEEPEDCYVHDQSEVTHDHHDDNMQGIFLHILADTLGSVGVIISTIIIKFTGWNFVDPVASMMIATLILISAIPLLKSSSSSLLLSLNDESESKLKHLLNEVLKVPGVKSYTTPRFWPQDGPNSQLTGYLHIQHFRTENSLSIKNKVDKLFSKSGIVGNVYLQLENEVDDCWCRKSGVFSTY